MITYTNVLMDNYCPCFFRMLVTDDFIFSTSFDKTAKAWLFNTEELEVS